MDKSSRIIPAFFLVLIAPALASADALCNFDDTVRMETYLKKGREAEKAGKTRDALLYYRAIDSFCGNGAEAKSSIMRIGLKSGAKAANRGRLISEEGLFRKVEDEDCRKWMRYLHIDTNQYETAIPGHCSTDNGGTRVELNQQAGAFEWYEATFNYGEADQALLKLMSKWPDDIMVYDRVFRHFQSRKRLNSTGYMPDKSIFAEVTNTALSNLDSLLAREEKEYAASKLGMRPMKTLKAALRWAAYLGEDAPRRVKSRAIARGDAALESVAPEALADAIAYFSFAEKGELKAAVLNQANELGRAALEKKDYLLAEAYFKVEGNEQMVDLSRKLAQEGTAGPAKNMP